MRERSDFSSDSEFRQAADSFLEQLWDQVDDLDMDEFEPQRTPGSLTILLEDGSVFMLSLQTPIHEIWLSANYTAWHFLREGTVWVERDSSEPLYEVLTALLSEKAGQNIQFSF